MRLLKIVPSLVFLGAVVGAPAQGCGESPIDDKRADRRLFQVKGVIQGALTYTGARPCSRDGHIVGNAIMLVFDKRNPPPPTGLANTAINFGVIPGDTLFANEPRNPGANLYCPKDKGINDTVLVSAPFDIAPMDDGQYIIQAFFDYTGDFLPTFKIRNLPMAGDVIGGYVDTVDASKHLGDVNYQPIFLPVNIGYPDPKSPSHTGFTIPPEGFISDNITVSIGVTTPLPRPYFYPKGPGGGSDTRLMGAVLPGSVETCAGPEDPGCDYAPVVTMPQDWHVKALPTAKTEANIQEQNDSFLSVDLMAGVPDAEVASAAATDNPKLPFHFQTAPFAKGGGLRTWSDPVKKIPETNLIPAIWPLVVFAKLQDAPDCTALFCPRSTDPQALLPQGSKTDPVVILQGLTVWRDRLFETSPFGDPPPPAPGPGDPTARVDHVRVLIRPSVICFHSGDAISEGGILVTPFLKGDDPGSGPPERQIDIADLGTVIESQSPITRRGEPPRFACLPPGRYGINAVYPTGQAWTVPNEAGSCAKAEGKIQGEFTPNYSLACTEKPRPVLYSQGTRAVLEIIANPAGCNGTDPTGRTGPPMPVPDDCLPCAQRVDPKAKKADGSFKFPECQ